MAQEIEHKFLVKGKFKNFATSASRIVQGYLHSGPKSTVRVRIYGDNGYLTIKGPSSNNGLERYEFETEIPLSEAENLMKLCETGIIDKTRHIIPFKGKIWEVDEFHGDNEGLIMAEIEVNTAEEHFSLPPFIGQEVTGDPRFYNSSLRKYPFSNFSTEFTE